MKKATIVFSVAVLLCMTVLLGACGNEQTFKYKASMANAGFERGDLSGWTATGDFEVKESPNKAVKQDGRYYVQSSADGKGELVSSTFILQDTGYVSFLIGAGEGDCYVEIYVDGVAVKKVTNPYFTNNQDDVLRRVLVNLTEYIGKEIYFKIVDNSENLLYSYINVDSFDVNVTVTDLAVYKSVSREV